MLNDCSFKWSLSSLINLFDYHQRVPTQIDWFIIVKERSSWRSASEEADILAR
ncbi:hypothetical protein VCHC59A1_0109 [Vibrio cholerae HC-59A1]|nr:hypothetical protein VCHC59A1_0109 [Vibrio cholerae HC-59A1]